MEDLLRELIAVNREMLAELRMLRSEIARGAAATSGTSDRDAPQEAGLSYNESKSPPPRFTPEDLEDIHGSLLEGLKKRNRDKSNAFSEFEKRHKNW